VPNTLPPTQDTIADSDKNAAERHNALRQASDPDTPADTLINLSKSNDELIRGAVAFNKSTPDEALDALLNEKNAHVLSCLRKRGIRTKPLFIKANRVIGNNLILRNVNTEDAAFILELRIDANKSKHISKTSSDLQQQVTWLKKYAQDDSQIYFIIQNKNLENVGTVRLYDQKEDSFCWGSWIIKDGSPSNFSIESALIVYHYSFWLGFNNAHFDVRKGNASVWKFHERFGATRIGESSDDYFYSITYDAISKSLEKYSRFLPNGISIETSA